MAVITVTTTADSGAGSLRAAISQANVFQGRDTIVFDAALAGQTIVLTSGELSLLNDVIIDGDVNGDDKADITISGNNNSRIFKVIQDTTDVDLKSLTLTNGSARGSDFGQADDGGAISMYGATLDITDCTIKDSVANYGGGGLDINNGAVRIANSLFTGNSSGSYGGAIRVFQAESLSLVNSTVSGNTTEGAGGGIFQVYGTLRLDSSTVTANSATGGGGLFLSAYSASTLVNTVVAGNTANDVAGTVTTANHSFFGTTVTITNDTNSINGGGDAGLGGLADNGGTVLTHAPETNSPLIDAGTNGGLPNDVLDIDDDGNRTEELPLDGRGGPRVNDGTVDIGAVESAIIVVTTADDVVNAVDGVMSLREAVALANGNADASVIGFAAALAGQTLTLTGGELALTNDVTIDGDTSGDEKADVTISGNDASRVFTMTGGNTDVNLLSLTLTDGNAAIGGAIYANSIASLDIVDSTITGNTSTGAGGGVSARYTTVSLTNSLLSGNAATGFGGGLYARGDVVTLTNSTLHGNDSESYGGGISGAYATFNILQSTITGNRANVIAAATTAGGGIDDFFTTVTVVNSVVADNFSGNGGIENDVSGTVATATGSVLGTNVAITNNNGSAINVANVGLGQLLDNGGTVLTRSPLDGSVMIGAGTNAAIPADTFDLDGDGNTTEPLPRDGRGGVRIVGNTVDAGAVERIVDEIIGGTAGNDTILGGQGIDLLRGRAGNDMVDGGSGNDTVIGGAGDDTLDGGTGGGTDTADFSDATGAVTVNLTLAGAQAVGGGLGSDSLLNFDNLIGGGFGDTLTGNSGNNALDGGAGNDTLTGGGGNDTFDGGSGNDAMAGNGGNDTYVVSAAGDTVTEQASQGTDTVQASVDYTLGANVERLRLFGGNPIDGTGNGVGNIIDGNQAANVLTGLAGADRLDGKGGADTLVGGTGNEIYFVDNAGDTIVELAGEGTDLVRSTLAINLTTIIEVENATVVSAADVNIIGSSRDNVLTGGNGDNQINGGGGDDTIRGNFGADRLIGAAGADTFLWLGLNESVGAKQDRVDDFLFGTDTIDLTAIDADATQGGNQDFVLDTNGSFSAGELRQTQQGADLLLEANVDGDATPEMAILFKNIASLAAGDFV